MDSRVRIARDLATALSSGAWSRTALARRARKVLGSGAPKSLGKLVDELIDRSVTPYAPPPDRLVGLILNASAFDRASGVARRRAQSFGPLLSGARFTPLTPLQDAPFPKLTTTTDLAGWLDMPPEQLDWLADAKRQHGHAIEPALQNYTYSWVPSGAASHG